MTEAGTTEAGTTAAGPDPGVPDLVAEAQRVSLSEGAGLVASARDLGAVWDADGADPGDLVGAAVPVGLQALGAAMNPLGALSDALVGWMLEHIAPLQKFLDWLAGAPAQVTAHARTWHNLAAELDTVAERYRSAVGALRGWDGAACSAYRAAATTHLHGLRTTAEEARVLSDQVLATGAHVGTVRALVRDIIADLVRRLITWFAAMVATSGVSFGASIAAGVPLVVADAASTAARIAARVAELLDNLATSARAVSTTADRIADAARFLGRGTLVDDAALTITGGAADAAAVGARAAAPVARAAARSLDDVAVAAGEQAARWAEPGATAIRRQTEATVLAATPAAVVHTQQQKAEAAPRQWGDDRPRDWRQMVERNR